MNYKGPFIFFHEYLNDCILSIGMAVPFFFPPPGRYTSLPRVLRAGFCFALFSSGNFSFLGLQLLIITRGLGGGGNGCSLCFKVL